MVTPIEGSPATARLAEVGDVVQCRDEQFRESLKIPAELGLVIEARKDRARVFLPSVGGEPWIPVEKLARVKEPVAAQGVPLWMQRAWFLARSLDPLFMEVTHVADDGCALRIFHGEVEIEALDAIRAALGDELRYWRLLPAGMHKMESAVAFLPRERADAPRAIARADS